MSSCEEQIYSNDYVDFIISKDVLDVIDLPGDCIQKIEEENLQIVKLVKTVNLDQKTLTVFLKAYAKGDIVLPDTYKAELEKNDKKEKSETTGEQRPHEQKHAQEGGNNEKK